MTLAIRDVQYKTAAMYIFNHDRFPEKGYSGYLMRVMLMPGDADMRQWSATSSLDTNVILPGRHKPIA